MENLLSGLLRPTIFLSILHRASILLPASSFEFSILSADYDRRRHRNQSSSTRMTRAGHDLEILSISLLETAYAP